MTKNFFAGFFLFIYLTLNITPVFAWVYPEHRDIMLFAIQKLPADYRTSLDELWALGRTGYEFRLSEAVIEPEQLLKPEFLDYAAWPAIAGDHSCSAENMLYNILKLTGY